MKKIIVLLPLLLAATRAIKACDICGCGFGSNYIGLLPDFKQRFIGLRYQYKSVRTHIGPDGSTSYLTSKERYYTAELWGGWNIGKKIRLLAFVPYNFNTRNSTELSGNKNGLGDISFTGFYQLMGSNTTTGNHQRLVQSLWVGGGFKLPTGKYEPAEKERVTESPNNFQLGTGSLDFTLNMMYDIRLQDAGLSTRASYKINTNNGYSYRYGNIFTGNLLAYYKWNIAQKLTMAPAIGVLYETAGTNTENHRFSIDQSGGYTWWGSAGAELSMKKIALGFNYQNPLAQNLASGFMKTGGRMMAHVSLLF